MKSFIWAALFLMAGSFSAVAADYVEANHREIEVSPKDYRNKKVTYTATYNKFSSTFPAYMQWNHFVSDKYILIEAGGAKIPVIIKKNDEVVKILAELRRGTAVRISGKIKEFSIKSPAGMLPEYYMLADKIEVEENPDKQKTGGDLPPEKPSRKRPGRFPRRR